MKIQAFCSVTCCREVFEAVPMKIQAFCSVTCCRQAVTDVSGGQYCPDSEYGGTTFLRNVDCYSLVDKVTHGVKTHKAWIFNSKFNTSSQKAITGPSPDQMNPIYTHLLLKLRFHYPYIFQVVFSAQVLWINFCDDFSSQPRVLHAHPSHHLKW
jgi:hypothetical protein